jgi:hypothetical protein
LGYCVYRDYGVSYMSPAPLQPRKSVHVPLCCYQQFEIKICKFWASFVGIIFTWNFVNPFSVLNVGKYGHILFSIRSVFVHHSKNAAWLWGVAGRRICGVRNTCRKRALCPYVFGRLVVVELMAMHKVMHLTFATLIAMQNHKICKIKALFPYNQNLIINIFRCM